MKDRTRQLLKALIFLSVFFMGIYIMYSVFRWKDTNGDYYSSLDALQSLDDNTVDLLFVGPSFTYAGMNPAYYWEEYGISALTMSISGQDKISAVACLEETLKTQSPKVVMVDLYGASFEKHAVKANVYRNFLSFPLSVNNIEKIYQSPSIEKDEKSAFILRWPIIHTRYKELKRYDFVQYMPSVYSMGFRYSFDGTYKEPIYNYYFSDEVTPISDSNKEWIDTLIDLSEKNDFLLLFYLTPGGKSNEQKPEINGISQYLEEKNIDFFDMNTSPLIYELDYNSHFSDGSHLNVYGAMVVQEYVKDFLFEHYEFDNHHGEENYEIWDMSVKYKDHLFTDRYISTSTDLYGITSSLADKKDYAIVFSAEGENESMTDIIYMALENLGVYDFDAAEGGSFVFDDGEIVKSLEVGEQFFLKVNDADTLTVSRPMGSQDEPLTNVMLGKGYYRNDGWHVNGLYLFIYDKMTDEVVFNQVIIY